MSNHLAVNGAAWDIVAEKFAGGTCLPAWGPFGEAKKENFFGRIAERNFLEICCGSGHSLRYLLENGASQVTGIDFSVKQIELAEEVNKQYARTGRIRLFNLAMEKVAKLKWKFDTVFSIYGLGWSSDLNATIQGIHEVVKPGGRFVFSWEHPYFSRFGVTEGKIVLEKSYLEEGTRFVAGWAGSEGAYLTHRRLSTWTKSILENGFQIMEIVEPEAVEFSEKQIADKISYYSQFKATQIAPTIIFVCIAV